MVEIRSGSETLLSEQFSKSSGSRPFGGNSVSADSLSSVESVWRTLDTSEARFAAFKK
jgi:hypothetical protein